MKSTLVTPCSHEGGLGSLCKCCKGKPLLCNHNRNLCMSYEHFQNKTAVSEPKYCTCITQGRCLLIVGNDVEEKGLVHCLYLFVHKYLNYLGIFEGILSKKEVLETFHICKISPISIV